MITRDETADLRPEEKDAILDTILGMAWTDGEVQPEEIALLDKIAHHFTDRDVKTLLAEYKTDYERVGRKIARSDLGPAGRRVLIKGMAYMAAASGNVTDAERVFYQQCLRAFGVPDAQRQRIEAQVKAFIYGEWFRDALSRAPGGVIDDAARRALDERRKSLELDDDAAAKIEDLVRRDASR
jgi:uncharacterized membrane protein YebE (DUF533 family)